MKKITFKRLIGITGILIFLVLCSCNSITEIKNDVLEQPLNILGESFFSLMEDGPTKKKLQEQYDQFKKKALQGEVESNDIETVAANILNASNSQNSLTPKEAEGILFSAISLTRNPTDEKPKKAIHFDKKERKALGENILKMIEFNDKLHKTLTEKAIAKKEWTHHVFYNAHEGLMVKLHEDLKMDFDEKEFILFSKEIEELESENFVKWEMNLTEELSNEQFKLRIEIDSLRNYFKEGEYKFEEEALKNLEFLDHSIKFKYTKMVDVDSILEVVNKSLQVIHIDPGH